jgi:Cu-processing system ATP-binding protein
VIAFESFTKQFGAQRAVHELTLEVEAGEVVALIGPNGSGKTTSLKAAAGLLRPTAGRVLLGNPGRPATDPSARRTMSYMPQRVAFPEALSGREVLEFFRSLRGTEPDRIDQVLRFSSLNGASARHVVTYSGGMLQRLGLAVAMLPDAPILLLDEPTAALDPDGLCAFYGLVEQRKRAGKAVFFTSHQIGDVERLADRFAVLVEGRLVASLSQAELRDRLAERGVMRLRLGVDPTTLLSSVRTLAPKALAVGDELIVPGGAALRPRVLDLVTSAGAPIRGLTAEEGRLDTFYKELVGAHA